MVCMAIEGAMQVKGGNWQIFDNMLKAADADVYLNTTVSSITRSENGYAIQTIKGNDAASGTVANDEDNFDAVVLAAPLQFSNIDISALTTHIPDKIPYVNLHVTLFATSRKLAGVHFNMKPTDPVPDTVLTTLGPSEHPANHTESVGKTGFFSISTLRIVTNPVTQQQEYVYKIFSPRTLNTTLLCSLFGFQSVDTIEDLQELEGGLSWYYEKVWNSYPYMYPRVTFEEIELAQGLWYTSGIESFISTMETSALMGMNVAKMIVDGFVNEDSSVEGIPAMTQHAEELKVQEEL